MDIHLNRKPRRFDLLEGLEHSRVSQINSIPAQLHELFGALLPSHPPLRDEEFALRPRSHGPVHRRDRRGETGGTPRLVARAVALDRLQNSPPHGVVLFDTPAKLCVMVK